MSRKMENGIIREMAHFRVRRDGLRTWVEVKNSALLHNYRVFRGAIKKDCLLMAVAKSNAYGHDLVQFAKAEEQFGIDWFGVDSITEAVALRNARIKKPILVLGHTLPERIREASEKNVSITVSNFDTLKAIASSRAFKNKLPVHVKIDTGMHRQGFLLGELPRALWKIKALDKKIVVEGLYTHFAAAKNPAFPSGTLKQIDEFKRVAHLFYTAGFKPMCHAVATSGTLLYPQAHFDMVRVGIGLYGLWPSKEVRAAREAEMKLKPALTWKTIVGEIKRIGKGDGVGYDLTEALPRDSLLAVCPVGYWHGIPRCLSSVGCGLVRGRRARIIGRVSMDMIVLDISRVPGARVGDEAVLIGRSGKEEISADEAALLADTVNYEIVTRLNPLMKRFYV